MSDITDRDRRAARQWAEDIAETFKYDDETPRETRAAVDYILATVAPPIPTLEEDIRRVAENCPMAMTASYQLLSFATRAEQMENDFTEAAQQVKPLNRELARVARDLAEAQKERDEGVQQVKDISNREAELEARIASLRSQSVSMTPSVSLTDNHTEPKDVPPGQAWLISVRGSKAVAARDDTDEAWQWSVAFFDGGIDDVSDESITRISRLVPAPRVITDPDELDKLAENSVVFSVGTQYALQHGDDGDGWYGTASERKATSSEVLSRGPVGAGERRI